MNTEQTAPGPGPNPGQRPPPSPAGRVFALLVIFLYLYSAPDPYSNSQIGGVHSPKEQFNLYLARQRHAYSILDETRWGSFRPSERTYLNLTGFGENDGYAWLALENITHKVEGERNAIMGLGKEDSGKGQDLSLYKNVTGVVNGRWVRSSMEDRMMVATGKERMNLSEITPGTRWGSGDWKRNVTGREGNLMMVVEEKDEVIEKGGRRAVLAEQSEPDNFVREISATMTVGDDSHNGDGWEIKVHGVHWPERGAIVMTTTSAKFAGIFGLPHLMTSKEDFESTQVLLNRTLDAVLKKKEKSRWFDMSDPWSQDESTPIPHCEYVVYVQVNPVRKSEFYGLTKGFIKDDLAKALNDIEVELRFPQGAPSLVPPSLQMSLRIFSPDCGFIIESKGPPDYSPAVGQHLVGFKQEVFLQRVKRWSLIWACALISQVFLLRMQMKESSTPSTLSRISHYTIGMMLTADCLLLAGLMLLAAAAPSVFPTASLAAFAVVLALAMGIRFVTDVYNVQEPERREHQRASTEQPAANLLPALIITAAGADTLPLPVTATRPPVRNNTTVIVPSDQDVDAEIAQGASAAAAAPTNNQTQTPRPNAPRNTSDLATSYGQFAMLFLFFLFLTLSSTSWPTTLRTTYVNALAIVYLSFWIPQIYRNVIRNCRKAFLWKFVLGQSILRIVPFVYFYLKEDNVIFAEKRMVSMVTLAGWLWIQLWILAAQEVLGPRFGLPKGWLPQAWDYHPILREDAEGLGMPIGLVQQASNSPRVERIRSSEEYRKSEGNTWCVDCAICMHPLEIPVVLAGEDKGAGGAGGVAGMLARRQYMVTPCRHAFHSACLEGWMRFRLQCPICRENLPPL